MPEMLAERAARHKNAILAELIVALDVQPQQVQCRVDESDRQRQERLCPVFVFCWVARRETRCACHGVAQIGRKAFGHLVLSTRGRQRAGGRSGRSGHTCIRKPIWSFERVQRWKPRYPADMDVLRCHRRRLARNKRTRTDVPASTTCVYVESSPPHRSNLDNCNQLESRIVPPSVYSHSEAQSRHGK